jgi:hypothetical protein
MGGMERPDAHHITGTPPRDVALRPRIDRVQALLHELGLEPGAAQQLGNQRGDFGLPLVRGGGQVGADAVRGTSTLRTPGAI